MKEDSAARKVQDGNVPTMKVVQKEEKPNKADVINKSGAEVVEFTPVPEQPKTLTIDELKRKVELLTRLAKKHNELVEKKNQVENFKISHDNETASIVVHDANGQVFNSNSPKTIAQLIEFWLHEFSEAIEVVEKQMREVA